MSELLTDSEMRKLHILAKRISSNLSCHINPIAPCSTCRLEAVGDMIKYIHLHGYKVSK